MSNNTPLGAQLLATAGTGTTTASATFPAVANRSNFVTGIVVTSSGATAAGTATVTLINTIGGTLTFVYPQVAIGTNNQAPLVLNFNTPILCSPNTNNVCSVTTGAGTTSTAIVMTGYIV